MGSILGSKRGPKTRFSADSVKNAFRTCFSTIFACKNESKTQAFCEQPYAGKSCKARSAAKCGCAESYVKYSVRGLCGKTPKIEAATEELQKSTKKRPKNGAKKRRETRPERPPKTPKMTPKRYSRAPRDPPGTPETSILGVPARARNFDQKTEPQQNRFFPRLGRF